MTDSEEKILLANPAAERLFNFKEATVTGLPLIEAVHDYEIDEVVKKCLSTTNEQTAQLETKRTVHQSDSCTDSTRQDFSYSCLFQISRN